MPTVTTGPRVVLAERPAVEVTYDGETFHLDHGAVVIAAITSCTNTSNPAVMIGAGLLAKKAVERGLARKPWVKSSLAPGSKVVTEYYEKAGLTPFLEELGFHTVGYGCTTCIGNSGPLPDEISRGVAEGDLVVCAVLSGNRNFEARIHPEVKANYLASPPLVVAYALAGRMDVDLATEPIGVGSDGEDVFLADIWPSPEEVRETVAGAIGEEMFRATYADVFTGDDTWRGLPVPEGELFAWDPASTYVRLPTYFDGMPPEPGAVDDIVGARCLVAIGDSVTTDHISPAGSIKPDSPAGRYLVEHGVERKDFNSYGSRRGNHEVMVRGTFANVRLRNELVPGSEGTWTVHVPSGDELTIYEAAERYAQEGTPLVVLAGKEYGSGSSRDWAAKGPKLLGVQAVIAESYERIHRSNLLMMGLLPLQYLPGESRESLGLTGHEEFSIVGLENGEAHEVTVRADEKEFRAIVRLDTPREREYLRHGGILPYVLRRLLASRARQLLRSLPADEDRPAEVVALVAQVVPLRALVSRPDLGRVRSSGIGREPALDRLPVQRLVAIPVVLGRRDDRDDRARPRSRRSRTVPSSVVHGSCAVLVVLRKRKASPERLADDDVATRANSRRERVDGVGEAPVDEARAETERSVVRLRLVRRRRSVGQLEGESIAEPRFCGTLDGDRMEVRRDLDAMPRAAELGGEENRRPATPRRDVEDARVGAEPETLPEKEELLLRRRVLDLVRRLRDDEVAGNHGVTSSSLTRRWRHPTESKAAGASSRFRPGFRFSAGSRRGSSGGISASRCS